MPRRESYIEQAAVFDLIGKPHGYDDLNRMQKHYMRQGAKGTYDSARTLGQDHDTAARQAFEGAQESARYYAEQNRRNRLTATCGAKTKRTGQPCKAKPEKGRKRCKFHGGRSTGPRTLQGRIKALTSLKQYRARPDLLAGRIEALQAEHAQP